MREQRPGEGGVPRTVEEMERQQAEESQPWRDAETPRPQTADPGPASAAGSPIPKEEYRALLEEYESAHRDADKAFLAATTDQARRAAFLEFGRLEWSYARRFLEIARNHPDDPVAIDALTGLVASRFTPPEADQAAEILIRDHLRSDKLLPTYRRLATSFTAWSKAAERLLHAAAENGPTPDDRGQACLSLGLLLVNRAADLRKLRGPEPDPFMKLEELARSGGRTGQTDRSRTGRVGQGRGDLFQPRAPTLFRCQRQSSQTRRDGRPRALQAPRAGRGTPGPRN